MKLLAKSIFVVALVTLMFSLLSTAMTTEGKGQTAVQKTSLPKLIEIGRGTCTPCKMLKPILEDLKKEYAGVLNVEIIDVRDNPDAMKKYNIRAFPFQIFYDASGREVKRNYGIPTKEQILDMFKSVGIDVRKAKAEKKK